MKILYISNGLTHYYNRVLSKLNQQDGVELTVVTPPDTGTSIGEGVHQTRNGADFQIVELPEIRKFGFYYTFKGLSDLLRRKRFDVVIVLDNYLWAFLFDIPLRLTMRRQKTKLILKTIPFRLLSYSDAARKIKESDTGSPLFPPAVNQLMLATGMTKSLKLTLLWMQKHAFQLADAHVNYVEAYEVLASYGVRREKIFITRNSPDTDLLFGIKDSLAEAPPLLAPNPRRLLHVGRLVAWKRVDMLIRSFARLRPRFPDAEIVVIGYGPEESSLKILTEELNLGTSVTFTGGVYDPRLLGQYYLSAGLYVLAGMGGLSINEAMCFGLPVLCSVCDGTEKILVREGVNGRYFEDGDEEDFTSKLSWFLEHPERLKEMGHKSEEIIRAEVNINTVIRGYMDALNYVCGSKAQPMDTPN